MLQIYILTFSTFTFLILHEHASDRSSVFGERNLVATLEIAWTGLCLFCFQLFSLNALPRLSSLALLCLMARLKIFMDNSYYPIFSLSALRQQPGVWCPSVSSSPAARYIFCPSSIFCPTSSCFPCTLFHPACIFRKGGYVSHARPYFLGLPVWFSLKWPPG